MPARSLSTLVVLALAALPRLASAQKLDKDDKAFLDAVKPILLADEDKVYKSLKEKSDRLEFQQIFWARRDQDLQTAGNEYKNEYERARAEADRLYRVPTMPGSQTDCGRVFILLGKPDEVQQEGGGQPGLRSPEIWTYRDRPGRSFTGGKAAIAFDEECRAPGALMPQMDRVAAQLVVQPTLEYKVKDGRLVKLADLLPKDSAARALLKQPRQDFPAALQASYLKIADGGTALLGLVRGDAQALTLGDKQVMTRLLLAAGADINQLNAVRNLAAICGSFIVFLGFRSLGFTFMTSFIIVGVGLTIVRIPCNATASRVRSSSASVASVAFRSAMAVSRVLLMSRLASEPFSEPRAITLELGERRGEGRRRIPPALA